MWLETYILHVSSGFKFRLAGFQWVEVGQVFQPLAHYAQAQHPYQKPGVERHTAAKVFTRGARGGRGREEGQNAEEEDEEEEEEDEVEDEAAAKERP